MGSGDWSARPQGGPDDPAPPPWPPLPPQAPPAAWPPPAPDAWPTAPPPSGAWPPAPPPSGAWPPAPPPSGAPPGTWPSGPAGAPAPAWPPAGDAWGATAPLPAAPQGPAPQGPAPQGWSPGGPPAAAPWPSAAPYGAAPYGAAPYGPPPYGAPPYGAGPWAGQPVAPPARRRGNGLAWAVVVGVLVGAALLTGVVLAVASRPTAPPTASTPSGPVASASAEPSPAGSTPGPTDGPTDGPTGEPTGETTREPTGGPTSFPPTSGTGRVTPPPGLEEEAAPLGTPPAVEGRAPAGSYAFAAMQDDGRTPVGFSPCRPVHYVIRPDHEPSGGREAVQDAVAEVSRATGLRFVYDGTTEEAPTEDRESYQPTRYGDRWAPVLVTWATTSEMPQLRGDTVGRGGMYWYTTNAGRKVAVTGTAAFDFAELRGMDDADVREVLLHELGHVVGLSHVDDRDQLMYPTAGYTSDFGVGDLTGLAKLHTAPCTSEL